MAEGRNGLLNYFIMNCKSCGVGLVGRQKMYCSIRCKNTVAVSKVRFNYKSDTGFSYQSRKGMSFKLELIHKLGGACYICGYNKNISALEFHHKDPKTKLFNIDMRVLSNRSRDSVLKEVDKCSLVCSNCHQEIHNPHLEIKNLIEI